MKFIRPKVVISKCLEFDACRYDGKMISDSFIAKLKKYVDFIPICPEVEIELGIPRDTIRLERESNSVSLIQPETGLEFSDRMNSFSEDYLSKILHIFLIKLILVKVLSRPILYFSPTSPFSIIKLMASQWS